VYHDQRNGSVARQSCRPIAFALVKSESEANALALLNAVCDALAIAYPEAMAEGMPLSLRRSVASTCTDRSPALCNAFRWVFSGALRRETGPNPYLSQHGVQGSG
jgi:hypothetical protein